MQELRRQVTFQTISAGVIGYLISWKFFFAITSGLSAARVFQAKKSENRTCALVLAFEKAVRKQTQFCSVSVTIGFLTPDIRRSQTVSLGFFSAFVENLAFSPFFRPLTSFSVVTVIQRMSKMLGDWSEWTDRVLCFSTFSTVNFACVRLVRRTNSSIVFVSSCVDETF